jgi:hypothetical protein
MDKQSEGEGELILNVVIQKKNERSQRERE